ncbi:MobA/MobL family protein [Sphingobium sufflavum]|uniref:MobA/MobL family protein n=1 Tax=Sphingobium sufflavum TaxID=1129547 RepID=UPI001F46D005|nr:MobA/MobL family protein [Sphingobium sufflavum]MCE7796518.1 MobA/MobL family protein [Sphingobium sufflavum]
MLITKDQLRQARRELVVRPRSVSRMEWPDFKVRPISEEWMYVGRMPAYKSAVANVAYILRDSEPTDRFGPMPQRFAERRYELKGGGLMLPANAPIWAGADPYRIWREADAAAVATNDPTAMSAWHVMAEIPLHIPPENWVWLVQGFIQTQLTDNGAAVAWAVHAVEGGEDGWIIAPHLHMIVTARHWRHEKRHGQRHFSWIASWAQQMQLQFAWRRRCISARDFARAGFTVNDRWPQI